MKKILIIEDNSAIRENLEELLMLSDYEVVTAADGEIGINRALRDLPDLILCDISMPKKDGYEVLKTLKEEDSVSQVPFVFLTANAQEKAIAIGKASAASNYLTKPCEVEELLVVIEKLLESSS